MSLDDADRDGRSHTNRGCARHGRTSMSPAQCGPRLDSAPNPSMSVEYREEPGGTDNQTMVSVPMAARFVSTSRAVRTSRIVKSQPASSTCSIVTACSAADVRSRYGDVLGSIRDLALLDELVAATERQRDLLRARVQEGASPPLERDLDSGRAAASSVSTALLQAGRIEAALVRLETIRRPGAGRQPLLVRDTLEDNRPARRSVGAVRRIARSRSSVPDVREAAARIAIADAKAGSRRPGMAG